ncbi:MAG: site-specific integrase [Clostridia bacterium]|nr:site-specific integrase [Clostridia bacterium]
METKSTKKNTKEKKSRYVTRTFTLPNDKRKYVYGKTAEEADKKLAELKAEVELGVNIDDDTTFGELAKIWLEKYKAPYIEGSTAYRIKGQVNAHLMPTFATMLVRNITSSMVRDWYSGLIENRSVNVCQKLLRYIREIFDLAVDIGCVAKSPVPLTMRPPTDKSAKKEKVVMPVEVEEYLLDKLPLFSSSRLMFMLCRYAGLRRGEDGAMNWDSIDLDAEVLHIRRNLSLDGKGYPIIKDHTKTVNGIRVVPIPDVLLKELRMWYDVIGTTNGVCIDDEIIHSPEGFLFRNINGGAPNPANLFRTSRVIKQYCANVDPEFAKTFSLHILRHTYVTRLFEVGVNVKAIQFIVGHSAVCYFYSLETSAERTSGS